MAKFLSVVNFSEGRDRESIESVAARIASAGATVMHYSLDADHHRAVVGFWGDESSLSAGILAGSEEAIRRFDIRIHDGEHPRFGAVDVVPIVPLKGTDMASAIALSREVGRQMSIEFNLPVFLYENSASSPNRKNLAEVRRIEKLGPDASLTGDIRPDFGPARFHKSAGAAAVGARGPLVAYNINLMTNNIDVAKAIALNIREIRDSGKGMQGVKALGMFMESRGIVQVSTNITLPDKTKPLEVFEFVRGKAEAAGVCNAESEIIGIASKAHLPENHLPLMNFPEIQDEQFLETWGLSYF